MFNPGLALTSFRTTRIWRKCYIFLQKTPRVKESKITLLSKCKFPFSYHHFVINAHFLYRFFFSNTLYIILFFRPILQKISDWRLWLEEQRWKSINCTQ